MRLSLIFSGLVCGALNCAMFAGAQDAPGADQPKADQPKPPVVRERDRPGPPPVREGERPPMPRREGEGPQPLREGNPPPQREGEDPRPMPRRDGERWFGPQPQFGEDGRPLPPRRPEGPPGEPFHDDPEMQELIRQDHELERQSFELSHRYREAKGAARDEARTALQKSVEEHFQVRQARRELQIKRISEELARLKEQVEARNTAREDIIRRRVQELVGDEGAIGF